MDNGMAIIAGFIAFSLLAYCFIAMLWPEQFG